MRDVLGLVLLVSAASAMGSPSALRVDVDTPGIAVSPRLYGIFFEEINRAGDGGIYAEMVQNRSFEDPAKLAGWTTLDGSAELDASHPLNARNRTSLRLDGKVANEGFGGMAAKKGASYRLSLYARGESPLMIEWAGATHTFPAPGSEWTKLETTLRSDRDDVRASLTVSGKGWVDMVSLFPADTWKGHGLRVDLMEMIAAMKPAFVRFPGGCFVEGDRMVDAFRWKQTIGDPAERPGHWNLWGYRSTDGLGYHEYLQMCEDLGAEPVFVINCGMAHKENVPLEQMGEFVQDALDAIEYANGPVDSPWGARRAQAGHPQPFGMKMMEIGNENGGGAYHERYALFHDAIKARYPEFRLIACDWSGVPKNRPLDLVDMHSYDRPAAFFGRATMFDHRDRSAPKVYFGEYAVTKECGSGNLVAALAEAAFMTGMERNSDVVEMSSYAPLLVHPAWKKWNPNAIVFDHARAYGTPSYWVQALFAQYRGERNLPVALDGDASSMYAVAGLKGSGIVLKVVNAAAEPRETDVTLRGWPAASAIARSVVLTSEKPGDENSFESPARIAPQEASARGDFSKFRYRFRPNSVTVLEITPEAEE